MTKKILDYNNITLTRKDVASILNCTPLTVYNREKKELYPSPSRNASNSYRIYDIADVFLLQMLTYNKILLPAVVSLLYDKGYTDSVRVEKILNEQFDAFKTKLDHSKVALPEPIHTYDVTIHE